MNNRIVLPADMDKECIALCNALNELPHIETTESCCGHLKAPFRVWLRCSSFTFLAIIARAIDKRYANTKKVWRLIAETGDNNPRFLFMLTSVEPYLSTFDMTKDTERIISNIRYWRNNFLDYFRSNGEVTNPGKKLAVTWQDIKEIDEWISVVQTSDDLEGKELYEEVLRRFNQTNK